MSTIRDFILRNLDTVAKAPLTKPVSGIDQGLFVSRTIAEYFKTAYGIESDVVSEGQAGTRDFRSCAHQLRLDGDSGLLEKIGSDGVQELIEAVTREVPMPRERPSFFADLAGSPARIKGNRGAAKARR